MNGRMRRARSEARMSGADHVLQDVIGGTGRRMPKCGWDAHPVVSLFHFSRLCAHAAQIPYYFLCSSCSCHSSSRPHWSQEIISETDCIMPFCGDLKLARRLFKSHSLCNWRGAERGNFCGISTIVLIIRCPVQLNSSPRYETAVIVG